MRLRAFILLCRAIVALAIGGAFSIAAPIASAGTYTVYSCGGPAGAANNAFRFQADSGMAAYLANCPANPYAANDDLGLVARASRQNGSVGWMNGAYVIMDAPVGAQIGAIHADINMNRPYSDSPSWSIGVAGFGTDTDRGINTNASLVWGCAAPATYSQCFYAGHVDLGVGKPSVRFEARCVTPTVTPCPTYAHPTAQAWVSAYNIAVDVSDSTLPSINVVGGGMSTGNWLRGDQWIRFDSSDNVGTKSAALAIDGNVVADWTNGCDYTRVVPCSNVSNGGLNYNVDGLSDGAHRLELYVTDTAGNWNSWKRTIYVDHTRPATPTVSSAGDWRNTNSFAVTVTNSPGQAAPITVIHYQVCDANGQNCTLPQGVAATNGGDGGQTTLTGIALPADGDYTIRAYEEDAAGNFDSWDLSDSSTAHLRLDRLAPAAPTGLATDGGEDWRSTNDFRLSWTNPTGQLAPITKAYVVACDASNACQTTVRSAADIAQASGVATPAVGDYATTVYLEDAAGNALPANASGAVHLRFDDVVPGPAHLDYSNGWLSATDSKAFKEHITYPTGKPGVAVPASGIAGYSLSSDGSDPDATIDVDAHGPGDSDDWPADATVTDLPEGTVTVKARAISRAGIAGDSFDATTLNVDKTEPNVTADGAPDIASWQRAAVRLVVHGHDSLSGMSPAASGLPATYGGYVSWRVDGGQPRNVAGDTAEVVVDSDGVHTVYYRAYDVAGNASAEESLKVRIDVGAPTGAFEALDAHDPRRVVADVSDATSGIASGTIQLRRARDEWKSLETAYDNVGHLIAKVTDDARMPDGVYEVRAVVSDRAGNSGIVDTRRDGSKMALAFPLRQPITLVASTKVVKTTSCRFVRIATLRHGRVVHRRIKVCKARKVPSRKKGKKLVLRPKTKQKRYVYAQLRDSVGNAIRNAAITIGDQPRTGGGFSTRAHLGTDAGGTVRYEVPTTGPSRTIRATFEGTEQIKPAHGEIQVLVPARTSIRVSPRATRTGHSVTFRGQLAGGYVPARGKLISLQVFFRGGWRTFAAPRTNKKGAWRYRYKFGARYLRPISYRFRAMIPREDAYPFERGMSSRVKVLVRP